MHHRFRRPLRVLVAALIVAAATFLTPSAAYAAGPRPLFQMPFSCGQTWEAFTYDPGHWPNANSIDLGYWVSIFGPKLNFSGGQAVLASAAGTILQTGVTGDGTLPVSSGNYIFIDHGGGWVTHYLHLRDAPGFTVGQVVAAGQEIGRVGNTGTGQNHLHYTQMQDGSAVRIQFNGANINTWSGGSFGTWGNGEQLTSNNCGGGSSIVAQHSGKCIATPANNAAQGAQLIQQTCNGSANQKWTFTYLGMGHYRMANMGNGKCLDTDGGALGHMVAAVQSTCAFSSTQSWVLGRQPSTQTTWFDYRVTDTLCLDVPWASQSDGVGMIIANCWGGANQTFRTA